MSLAADLFSTPIRPCKAGRVIARLDQDSREAVERALAIDEDEKSTQSIADVLNRYVSDEDRMTPNTLRDHRRRLCKCFSHAAG